MSDIPSDWERRQEKRLLTAMCLWENFVSLREEYRSRSATNLDERSDDEYQCLIIELVDKCIEAWDEVVSRGTRAIEDGSPYGSVFCHLFLLRNIDHIIKQKDENHGN